MLISEIIRQLEKIKEEEGDLQCCICDVPRIASPVIDARAVQVFRDRKIVILDYDYKEMINASN